MRLLVAEKRGADTASTMLMSKSMILIIDFDMSMVEAVSAPRFSATSNLIDVSNRISRQTTRPLEDLGYTVVRNPNTYGFAAVHGIKIQNQEWQGAADPGHDGIVVEV
jgi:gamma-glutamyltranspeptidase/glutathione hydrolase